MFPMGNISGRHLSLCLEDFASGLDKRFTTLQHKKRRTKDNPNGTKIDRCDAHVPKVELWLVELTDIFPLDALHTCSNWRFRSAQSSNGRRHLLICALLGKDLMIVQTSEVLKGHEDKQ
ncbi:hypothetical protein TNCV_790811 [Trichonephila clavipes]|nr:hypothetical protein TNCV_790811 [Trichonephila clavipes]